MSEIKNYLNFYIGAEAQMPGHIVIISNALLADEYLMKHCGIKPFLRELSDMTDQEAREYASFFGIKGDHPVKIITENAVVKISIGYKDHVASLFPLGNYGQKPESLKYLLDRHFDMFGLIESGLAYKKPNPSTGN